MHFYSCLRYDESVRKIFIFTPLFLFFILSSFFISNIYAQSAACFLTVRPSEIGPEGNYPLHITSAGKCFRTEKDNKGKHLYKYTVAINPRSQTMIYNTGIVSFSRLTRSTYKENISPLNQQAIEIEVNLKKNFNSKAHEGSDNLGTWDVFVCVGELEKCDDNNFENLVNRGQSTSINVVENPTPITPTPIPASDLPIINYANQLACKFQFGEKASIAINNILPNVPYSWWWDWDDDKKLRDAGSTHVPDDPSLHLSSFQLTVDIPASETGKRGKRKFCIDLASKAPNRGCFRNGITLEFLSGPPDDAKCTEDNSRDLTPTPKSPLPPCSKWAYLNGELIPPGTDDELRGIEDKKCLSIKTAIGDITTEAPDFVRFIFGVVLGLAGGISLVLIIIAGYKFMASQGNPESLQAARDQLISAIIGLLFIILSFVILQVIGVDILHIPGFTP